MIVGEDSEARTLRSRAKCRDLEVGLGIAVEVRRPDVIDAAKLLGRLAHQGVWNATIRRQG